MGKRKPVKHLEVVPEVHARVKMQAFLARITIRDFINLLITEYEKTDANPLKKNDPEEQNDK